MNAIKGWKTMGAAVVVVAGAVLTQLGYGPPLEQVQQYATQIVAAIGVLFGALRMVTNSAVFKKDPPKE